MKFSSLPARLGHMVLVFGVFYRLLSDRLMTAHEQEAVPEGLEALSEKPGLDTTHGGYS